jgi:hypothetical protein
MASAQKPFLVRDLTRERLLRPCIVQNYACETVTSVLLEEDNAQLNWKQSPHTDRNYTMGFGLSRTGASVVESGHTLFLKQAERVPSWLLSGVGRLLGKNIFLREALVDSANPKSFGEMLLGTAFTPQAIYSPQVQQEDRPYAFLLGWTVRRSTVIQELGKPSITSELTIGTIGSRLGRNVQRAIHDIRREPANCDTLRLSVTGPCDPKGWRYQIHDTRSIAYGVPTIRYALAAEWLVPRSFWASIIPKGDFIEVVPGVGIEAGYYTDAYYSVRARIGLFKTPFYGWWESPLSAGNVIQQGDQNDPSIERYLRERCEEYDRCKHELEESETDPSPWEFFVHGGLRHRSWLYNALMEGYPRYAGAAVPHDSIARFTKEGEVGITIGRTFGSAAPSLSEGPAAMRKGGSRSCNIQTTWMLYQAKSPEFKSSMSRHHHWGGGFLSIGNACPKALWLIPMAAGVLALYH